MHSNIADESILLGRGGGGRDQSRQCRVEVDSGQDRRRVRKFPFCRSTVICCYFLHCTLRVGDGLDEPCVIELQLQGLLPITRYDMCFTLNPVAGVGGDGSVCQEVRTTMRAQKKGEAENSGEF